jgi:hypothetical protein
MILLEKEVQWWMKTSSWWWCDIYDHQLIRMKKMKYRYVQYCMFDFAADVSILFWTDKKHRAIVRQSTYLFFLTRRREKRAFIVDFWFPFSIWGNNEQQPNNPLVKRRNLGRDIQAFCKNIYFPKSETTKTTVHRRFNIDDDTKNTVSFWIDAKSIVKKELVITLYWNTVQ